VVAPLSHHYRFGSARQGLILGYAALAETDMAAPLAELRSVIAEVAGQGAPAQGSPMR
jgi:hypothetical protein